MHLVQLFSLTMVVLHMWRCMVDWQVGSCNRLYYTACSTELVLQIDYSSNVALRNSFCKRKFALMFATVVFKMVCELSFASLAYSLVLTSKMHSSALRITIIGWDYTVSICNFRLATKACGQFLPIQFTRLVVQV